MDAPRRAADLEGSAIAPIAAGEFVRDSIKNSSYVVLDATGHCPNLSAPAETIRAISAFVRS